MALLRRSALLVAFTVGACTVYNDNLIEQAARDDDDAVSATGAKSGTGGAEDDDDSSSTGGSGGSTTNSGGVSVGASDSGGSGAVGDGGASGGNPSDGGTEMGGAMDTGGSDSTGGSSTGGVPASVVLVDDLEMGPTYANANFSGGWSRYGQEKSADCSEAVWDAPLADSIIERDDQAGNHALNVNATKLDCWGVGVYLTLAGFSSVDLSDFDGVSFWARRVGTESTLRLRLEDAVSNQSTCDDYESGYYCDEHVASAFQPTLTTSWKQFAVDFALFKGRDEPLDLESVHSIHFSMDPGSTTEAVDFLIDDIELYRKDD